MGGLSGTGAALHHIDMYDPVLDLFEDGSKFDSQQFRQRYASGVIDTKIYVAGGLAAADPTPALVRTNAVFCFLCVYFHLKACLVVALSPGSTLPVDCVYCVLPFRLLDC